MDGWKYWEGKKVYVILKNKRNYSGIIIEVVNTGNNLIFITLIDKFDQHVCFTNSEIEVIQEEKDE